MSHAVTFTLFNINYKTADLSSNRDLSQRHAHLCSLHVLKHNTQLYNTLSHLSQILIKTALTKTCGWDWDGECTKIKTFQNRLGLTQFCVDAALAKLNTNAFTPSPPITSMALWKGAGFGYHLSIKKEVDLLHILSNDDYGAMVHNLTSA